MSAERVRRRGWVVATLVVGAALLAFTLGLEPGNDLFLPAGFVLAAIWAGGALLSGPMPKGDGSLARALALGFGVGAFLLGGSLLVALVVAEIPVLREPAEELLDHADGGTLLPVFVLTAVSGVAEEMFFRGALYDAVPTKQAAVVVTTVLYTVTTAGSAVVLLVLAAAMIGAVTAVLRGWTGGLAAPIATHLTWSLGMLLLLPHALATGR